MYGWHSLSSTFSTTLMTLYLCQTDVPVLVGFCGISLSLVTSVEVEGCWAESPGAGGRDVEASADSVSMSDAGDTGLSSRTDSLLLVLISNGCSFLHKLTSCWENHMNFWLLEIIPITCQIWLSINATFTIFSYSQLQDSFRIWKVACKSFKIFTLYRISFDKIHHIGQCCQCMYPYNIHKL